MANIFKGMSQSKFLDDLATMTGLNGHELYNHLVELVNENKNNKTVEEKPQQIFECGDAYIFTGTLSEIRQFYLDHGGNPKIEAYFGGCCAGLICSHVASALKVRDFSWIREVTVMSKGPDGKHVYHKRPDTVRVVWDEHTKCYVER